MRGLSVLTVTVLLLGAALPVLAGEKGAPAAAAPAAPAAAAATPPAAADSRLMAQLVQASAPYQALVLSSEAFLGEVMDGGQLVLASEARPAAADVAAWKARVLASQARIRAERAALPAFPSSRFAAVRSDPEGARLLTAMAKLPKVAGDVADNSLTLADRVVPLVEKAALGDQAAILALRGVLIDGSIAALRAENALLTIGVAMSGEGLPQTALSRSMIASNEAIADFYEMLKAIEDEGRLRQLATKMAEDLNEAESQANKVAPLARYALGQADSSISPDLKRRIEIAFATYDESAKVELQLVALIRQVMARMAEDPAAAQALTAEAGPLVARRIELNNQRLRALGG
ncbi:hypothetical protein QO010_003236 [Caulobacter ginsengisoli]|uniref:DUF2059 domain-containing protein n=1 Tax=Caulobacter ginsengisoli TaxID=400775 RepID=A0ABU0IWP2_9CAUL|nr:hypothetical protein [Caulobacter ginsengisoli]MDQ0465449.1 hypothetical protein [Caulobacter ginsengisoli]